MTDTIIRDTIAHLLPPARKQSCEGAGAGTFVPADPVPVEAQWSWSPAEPYLLRLDIAQDLAGDRPVTWEISRDLLQAGLVSAAEVGEYDVAIYSTALDVHLSLSSPSGVALLRWDRAQVSQLLGQALAQVPNGADGPDVEEADAWLAAIAEED